MITLKKAAILFLWEKAAPAKPILPPLWAWKPASRESRTRFVTGCGLANELIEARDEKLLGRAVKRYAGYGLLIIDELGYVPFSKEGAQLIFQILAERHERKPVMITTNMGFGDWTQIFGDPSMTAALLDRVTHKAHVINCTWESYRLKETLKRSSK